MSRQARNRTPRRDTVASIRAEMERAETDRLRAIRLATGLAAVALLVAAALAVATIGSGVPPEAGAVAPSPVVVTEPSPPAASEPDPEPEPAAASSPEVQRIDIAIGVAGYEPSTVSAKAGIPIDLTVAKGEGCAAGFLMPSQGIQLDNSAAAATVSLGALSPGDYRFTCGMEMVEGVLQVR